MSTQQCLVFCVPMGDPADVSGIAGLFDRHVIMPDEIVAILGKTEGNGCVNNFTRGYATASLRALLVERGVSPERARATPTVMSGGTEGGLSPHFVVFAVREEVALQQRSDGRSSLAIGVAYTPEIAPGDIGRMEQVRQTAHAIKAAMSNASIDSPDDVHLVQIKCPLLTQRKLKLLSDAGIDAVTDETYASMGFSRAASSLGVALALGEIGEGAVTDASLCQDFSLYSGRASASAGSELDHSEIIVLGNSRAWVGPNAIRHAVMLDAIDVGAVYKVLEAFDIAPLGQLDSVQGERIKAVIAKAESSRNGLIRGARHIMLDDSDINATRHARALVGGVIAGVIGRTDLFVSGGAEHQGPDGGSPIAIIASQPKA